MSDYPKVTVQEHAKGISDTRDAIQRAQRVIERLGLAGAKRPAIWATLSDSTIRLRDHLIDDLDKLEAALTKELG